MKKKILTGTAAALAGAAGAVAAGGWFFYKLSIPAHTNLTINGQDEDEEKKAKDDARLKASEDWLHAQPTENYFATSDDGLLLHALWIPAKEKSNRTVIVVHGYRSSAAWDFGEIMPMYHDLGMNILAVDDRGHGLSEGDYIGYGWQDHFDVLTWINYLVEKFDNEHPVKADSDEEQVIFLHGISMGAATVMMDAGENLPKAVKGIIEDCGYSCLKDEMDYCMHEFYHMPSGPFREVVSLLTKKNAGYTVRDADCIPALKKASVPMLFIHGGADTFVPTKMVYKNYEACASDYKRLVIFPDAGHAASVLKDPEKYKAVLKKFTDATAAM